MLRKLKLWPKNGFLIKKHVDATKTHQARKRD